MSDAPKSGIYLDGALAVIGEQLDERIDELSRRRRVRYRVGVAALSVVALASGSVAAVALSSAISREEAPPAAVLTIEHELRCVEGESAFRDAYFTLRYRTAEESGADRQRLCTLAWSALEIDRATLRSATPEELIRVAEGLVEESLEGAGRDAAPAVSVSEASFGRLSGAIAHPAMVACESDDTTVVLAVAAVPLGPADEILLCARAGV